MKRHPKEIIEEHCRGCNSRPNCIQARKAIRLTDTRLAEILHGLTSEQVDPPSPEEEDNDVDNEENKDSKIGKKECDIVRRLAGEEPSIVRPPKPPPKDEPKKEDEATDDDIADFEDEFT